MREHEQLDDGQDFGALLKILRVPRRVKQATVVALLADKGWTATSYTRLENGDVAPSFDQLLPIYRALFLAGVSFSLADRHQFVERARNKIDGKKTHRDLHTDAEWAQLRYELARLDGLTDAPTALAARLCVPHKPLLADTDHLIGRESWRDGVLAALRSTPRTKLLVIHGPAGVGKSSELNWLATSLLCQTSPTHRVILCDLRALERTSGPEDAFCVLMGTILTELGVAESQPPLLSLDEHLRVVLAQLEKQRHPLVIFIDHAEGVLQQQGVLAPCWQHLFTQVLRGQHRVTLVVATTHWPGWYGGERCFVAEHALPALPIDKGVLLLQQQGLDSVPIALLEHVHDKVGGIPLALEWVAALVKEPLQVEDWEAFATSGQATAQTQGQSLTQAIERLLGEPHIFGGTLADAVAPLLQRILASHHLSEEAHRLLKVLAVATIALAKPALQVLCPQGPRPIKELRRASVLVAYPDRVQLLPMVAAAMYRHLTAEQRVEQETSLIQAYTAWLNEGTFHEEDSEQGTVITELAVLLLKHRRLLEVAEHVIRYGWISFNLGYGPRLARLAKDVMGRFDWQDTPENECAGLLVQQVLFMFLGENVDTTWQEHSQHLHDAFLADEISLPSAAEHHLIHLLAMYTMNELRFEDAQIVLDAYRTRLEARQVPHLEEHTPLLREQARLYSRWSEYAEEQGNTQKARELREQAIVLYKHYSALLAKRNLQSPLKSSLHKRSLAYCFNNLSYYLNRNRQHEEALQYVERSITLTEQGYGYVGALAVSYGSKSEILIELGRFQEALRFDEQALTEIQRCADTGYALSRDEVWVYKVNRGRLYLRLGRIDEAEQLLREALPHIRPERRMYRMFAEQALAEIEQWRQQATSPEHQLDWRWIGRYRELVAYNGYGWLAHAGPFTEEEQQQWDRLFQPQADEASREQWEQLVVHSRERELAAAIAEQREPRLRYPAIEIEDVRRRIAGLLHLDTEISQHEPNVIVRRLYQGAIEEEVNFLRLIEATAEGDTEKFWHYCLRLDPKPTPEEMEDALSHLKRLVLQGLKRPETAEVSQRLADFLCERLHVSLEHSADTEEKQTTQQKTSPPAQPQHVISTQAAKRFFEAALQESGCDGWRVEIDAKALHPRVEGGLRTFFLPKRRYWLSEVRYWCIHELAGHIARNVAGEHSRLGLLGVGTKGYSPTEEGWVFYLEYQVAAQHGQILEKTTMWQWMLATGLASGAMTPAQTFLSLHAFFTDYSLLHQLLGCPDADMQKAQEYASQYALEVCLRTYRGVPDLTQAGVCYLQDTIYLRGNRMIERAMAEDATVLDRLAVGKVGLDLLPDLQELGIVSVPQPLRKLAYDPDLNSHILSFEEAEQEARS